MGGDMKYFTEAVNNNELYIWVGADGVARVPGMEGKSSMERNQRLPEEVKEIKEQYWEFLFSEDFDTMIVTYQGDYGLLLQWDFNEFYTNIYDLTIDNAEPFFAVTAIDAEGGKWFGDILINYPTSVNKGYQLFWFIPERYLPVESFKYPCPRRVFDNIAGLDATVLEKVKKEYEADNDFRFHKSI